VTAATPHAPVYSMCSRQGRYLWAVWRSEEDTYQPPFRLLDMGDPIARGRCSSREEAIAAALAVAPSARKLPSKVASALVPLTKHRDESKILGVLLASMILGEMGSRTASRRALCALAQRFDDRDPSTRQTNARELLDAFNASVGAYHTPASVPAFEYAIRLLHGEAVEPVDDAINIAKVLAKAGMLAAKETA